MLTPVMPLSTPMVAHQEARLMQKAKELEAAFLAEMLSFAGLDEESDAFGGGVGESQFSSFLRAEQARLLVDRGGIGLAETIFESLQARMEIGDENA